MLAILGWGFAGNLGVVVQEYVPGSQGASYREMSVTLGGGRFKIWLQGWSAVPQGVVGSGWRVRGIGRVADRTYCENQSPRYSRRIFSTACQTSVHD